MGSRRALVLGTATAGALEVAAGIYLLAFGGDPRLGLFFCISGICTDVLAVALRALIAPPADGGEDGRGGGGDRDPEPPWWPEFEREFRAWAERSDRRRRSPAER